MRCLHLWDIIQYGRDNNNNKTRVLFWNSKIARNLNRALWESLLLVMLLQVEEIEKVSVKFRWDLEKPVFRCTHNSLKGRRARHILRRVRRYRGQDLELDRQVSGRWLQRWAGATFRFVVQRKSMNKTQSTMSESVFFLCMCVCVSWGVA